MALVYILALSCLLGSAATQILETQLKDANVEIQRAHEFSVRLFLNTNQQTFDWDLDANAERFKKPEAVKNFKECKERGFIGKQQVFNLSDPDIKEQTISIVDLMYFAKDLETLAEVSSWLRGQLNREQYTYALAVALVHRPDLNATLPPWYKLFPKYFIRSRPLMQRKERDVKENGTPEDKSHSQSPPPTTVPYYFMGDPSLSNMFYNWQIYFPTWMDPAKYDLPQWEKRAELFYRYHIQLLSAFFWSARYHMEDVEYFKSKFITWNGLKLVQHADLHNIEGKPILEQDANLEYNNSALEVYEKKIAAILSTNNVYINESYSVNILGDSMLSQASALVFNLTDSLNPSYYGNYYEALINFLSSYHSNSTEDGGSPAGCPMTALKDHTFYTVLARVSTLPLTLEYHNRDQKIEPIENLKLVRMEADTVTTRFGPLESEHGELPEEIVLRRTPFVVRIAIENSAEKPQEALITLFLDDPDDPPLSLEIDRFPVRVAPGNQTIVRDLKDSSVFPNEDKATIQCGIPNRLMLPKGTRAGIEVPLVAVMRAYSHKDDEGTPMEGREQFMRLSSLCGSTKLDHGVTVGTPYTKSTIKKGLKTGMAAATKVLVQHMDIQ